LDLKSKIDKTCIQ